MLQVTDSSEALLTGRRPPFRLVIWVNDQSTHTGEVPQQLPTSSATDGQGHASSSATGTASQAAQYAVSEEFVVATRRVKQANKADIPLVDDHVSKIEHIGRETVKKLGDMRAAAAESNVEMQIDDRMVRIETGARSKSSAGLVWCG